MATPSSRRRVDGVEGDKRAVNLISTQVSAAQVVPEDVLLVDDLCGNQNYGVAMPFPRRSTEPGRPRRRREKNLREELSGAPDTLVDSTQTSTASRSGTVRAAAATSRTGN